MFGQKTFCKESILFHIYPFFDFINGQYNVFIVLRYPHTFSSGPEEFKEYLSFGDKIKWPEHKPQNVFSAYGKFMCSDAIEVHDMVEIHPLVKSKLYHIGLFYNKMDGSYYKGPLPKTNPDVLEVLGDLASLLEVSKV